MKERKKHPQNENDNGGPYIQVQLTDGRWVLKHRYVMEKYLAREIPEGAIVHHRNRRRHDNEIDNLLLMRSQTEHEALHRALKSNNSQIIKSLETQSFEFMKKLKAGLPLAECLNLSDPLKPIKVLSKTPDSKRRHILRKKPQFQREES
jgi:hypothetical protein